MSLIEVLAHRLVQRRMDVLDRMDIISITLDDLRCDCLLPPHGIHVNDFQFDFQLLQEFRDGCDLLGL